MQQEKIFQCKLPVTNGPQLNAIKALYEKFKRIDSVASESRYRSANTKTQEPFQTVSTEKRNLVENSMLERIDCGNIDMNCI